MVTSILISEMCGILLFPLIWKRSLQPAATEYIVSPFNVSSLGLDDVVDIYLCINGLHGGRPIEDGVCPIQYKAIDQENE